MKASTRAYLAGPDVFLPNAREQARRKIALCAAHGMVGVAPLDDTPLQSWREIYDHNLALMRSCDVVIANLTPFRGASADAGTLVEVGWFLGRGMPVCGYSNSATGFADRSREQRTRSPDPIPDMEIEEFGLSDNLMIAGACTILELPSPTETLAPDSLVLFARCLSRLVDGTR